MRPFRYALDPLCLAACALYLAARLLFPAALPAGFWHDQFTDVLLVPAALPFLLWLHRGLGLRRHDLPPSWGDIALHAGLWAVAAECLAPRVFPGATGDWRDVLAYAAGAVLAGGWWGQA